MNDCLPYKSHQPRTKTNRRRAISLDNGVYILKTLRDNKNPKEYDYRVKVIHAIGNIFKDPKYLFDAFEDAEIYLTRDAAENAAIELDRQLFTEHDVLIIDHFSKLKWETIKELATKELEKELA